jgi:hypothetical protein
MKNFKILSLAIFSLFILSCEPDDDNTPALTNASLAGTYSLTAFNVNGTATQTFNNYTETSTFTLLGSDFNNCTFIFTEAGSVTSYGTFTTTTDYTEDGTTYTIVDTSELESFGTYTLTGNLLTISNSDETTVLTINNFSSNGLELFTQDNEVDDNYTSQIEVNYTLARR